ncbi:MAG: hypothetical protein NC489_08540 [Ruminococcus flavefaciens]|nr:hypothetical protein [Ruminococcus flavefaciens]
MPYNNNGYGGQARPNYGAPRNSAPRTSAFPPQSKTTGIRLTNERAGRFLDFNFWGRYGTIAISAVAAGSQITWDAIKNAQATQQNLAFGDLNELWDICSEVLETVKNTGTFTPTGMRVAGKGGDSIVEISNGSNLGLSPGIYLVIYKNLDSGNRTNAIEYYPFNETHVIRGYDHTTGTGKDDIIKVGEFKKFYRAVQEAAKAFTMAQAHAAATVSHSDKLAAFKAMAAITAAMGIDISKELDAIAKGGSSSKSSGGQQRQGASYGAPRSAGGRYGGNAPRNPGTFENGGYPGGSVQGMNASIDDPVDVTLSMDNLTNVDMSQFS